LHTPGFEAELDAAQKADAAPPARHPSRSLVERLIADDASWQTLHRHWQKLTDNDVKWEDLLPLDLPAIETKLVAPQYGLTGGAATAVARLVERFRQMQLVTPLMKALHAFPRALYHGHPVPDDLAPLLTSVQILSIALCCVLRHFV
jgi:hypothetical protein